MEEEDFKDEWDLVAGGQKPEWRQKPASSSLTTIYQAPHGLDIKLKLLG